MAYVDHDSWRCFKCRNISCNTTWRLRADQYVMITLTNLATEICFLFAHCHLCDYITTDIIQLDESLLLVELGTISLHYPLDTDTLEMISILSCLPNILTRVHCDLASMTALNSMAFTAAIGQLLEGSESSSP